MGFLSRVGLQYRIAGGVVLGLVALFSLFGFLAVRTINQSKDVALEERLRLAETTAQSVDALVQHSVRQLEAAALLPLLNPDDPDRQQMEWQYHVLGTFDKIVRLDAQGQVLWTVPASAAAPAWALAGDPQVVAALRRGQTTVVQVSAAEADHSPVAVVVTPVRDREGKTGGSLAGELHLSHAGAPLLPLPEQEEEAVRAEIVDARGYILAFSGAKEPYTPDEHVDVLQPLIASGRAGTIIHRVGGGRDHVVAYHPLASLPGGVVVEQREDEALALPREMQRTVLIFGLGALVVTSGAAWFHARTVVRPIQQLTGASERIAAGDLEKPITSSRGDEIGLLASRFEQMRVKLKASQEESRRWTEELEQRVRERTRELEALNRSRAELLGKVISVQEEERKRIARELHDESAQTLATLLVDLQAAEEALPPGAAEAKQKLARVRAETTKALTGMRQLILDLRPSALDDLGLVAAVRWYARSHLEPGGVTLSVQAKEERRRLPGVVETALFRIAQEAINNIARHAEARNVTVRFEFTENRVSLLVEDDGKGFDVVKVMEAEDRASQLGLIGMTERAALLGGKTSIESSPGSGTRVRIEVPLAGHPDEHGERG